ncbi:restriction endonuclease [bacterium]|nr:restriction endonuclease [bacterium]
MILELYDFNNADKIINEKYPTEWEEIKEVLEGMPLHLKESDQAGIQGRPIFDPVGTNGYIKDGLQAKHWKSNIPVPKEYDFMGTDIDFGKNGFLGEAQFSNYPFLLNNILRAELFFKGGVILADSKTTCLFIVTKAHMFPASNSTLYYEQAKYQLEALSKNKVFDAPIRLVGLKENVGEIRVIWTTYSEPRYSRTVATRAELTCNVTRGRSADSRCSLKVNKT